MKKLLRCLTCLALTFSLLQLPVGALNVDQARELLDHYYIDDLPAQAQQVQTLEELLALLNDPYTVYMSKDQYDKFMADMNDTKLVGIGVAIEVHEKGILISSVIENSPAQDVGLVSGDIIQSVNGTPITTVDQAQSLLTGESGTSVSIGVLKADHTTVQLELVRREISVPTTVQYALSEDGNACVILCSSFGAETASHFADALREHDTSVNGFIIDLSANPGGTSHSGAVTAGYFIGGAIMLYLRDGLDNYSYTYTLSTTPVLTQKSVIVLTSPYSASSSELFLGALRDHGVGIAMGQRTLGKGVAQIMLDESSFPDLFDGDALKVTVYRFFSPNGTTNDKIGIMPTLLISLENTYNASLLLCGDYTGSAEGYLKLSVADQNFYIHLETALSEAFRPAFVELLEALPPQARLRWDDGNGKYTDTTAQAVAKSFGLSEYKPRTFSDLNANPYAQSINTLSTYRLLGGYGDGTFRPDNLLTRAEFCAMLGNVMALKTSPVEQSQFYDVGVNDWYAPVVHELYNRGLLSGYDDGSFRPNNTISQQEVVSILAQLSTQLNMYSYNRRNITPIDEVMAEFAHFSDWAQQPAWLLDSCEVDLSSLSTPQDPTSRGLAAYLLCQLLTQTNVLWH